MKLGIISDLHMEFRSWLHEPDPELFYLCAGDVHPNALSRDYFYSLFGDRIFSVMGNHDYYKGSFKNAHKDFSLIEVGGLKIAGATLWTDISPVRWWDFKEYMMDYRNIKGMNYDAYIHAHTTHREFLFNSGADIWVTHHCPSSLSVHPRYKGDFANIFFYTELTERIMDMKNPPRLIVHGHTHEKFDYMIGDKTRVVCNPRGYPGEQPWYKKYEPLIVEL